MKTILCFGDSNTWGADPSRLGARFDRHTRWTGVLQNRLGADYHIIEEGMSGRTALWDDPEEGYTRGIDYLIPCLKSHKPLDLVIILLGTNDLQRQYNLTAKEIAAGMGELVKAVQQSDTGQDENAPPTLLICPPKLGTLSYFFVELFGGMEAKSAQLAAEYARVAQTLNCHFLDAGQHIRSSDLDGLHWEAAAHATLAAAVAAFIRVS